MKPSKLCVFLIVLVSRPFLVSMGGKLFSTELVGGGTTSMFLFLLLAFLPPLRSKIYLVSLAVVFDLSN